MVVILILVGISKFTNNTNTNTTTNTTNTNFNNTTKSTKHAKSTDNGKIIPDFWIQISKKDYTSNNQRFIFIKSEFSIKISTNNSTINTNTILYDIKSCLFQERTHWDSTLLEYSNKENYKNYSIEKIVYRIDNFKYEIYNKVIDFEHNETVYCFSSSIKDDAYSIVIENGVNNANYTNINTNNTSSSAIRARNKCSFIVLKINKGVLHITKLQDINIYVSFL